MLASGEFFNTKSQIFCSLTQDFLWRLIVPLSRGSYDCASYRDSRKPVT